MNRLKTSCFDLVVGDWIWWYMFNGRQDYPYLSLILKKTESVIIILCNDKIIIKTCYDHEAYRLIDVATPPV